MAESSSTVLTYGIGSRQHVRAHSAAMMAVLFLFFGVELIADALPAVAG
jgi:hypothetical protein